jgi:hypothetical protein
MARASLASSQALKAVDHDSPQQHSAAGAEEPLATALEKYAIAQEKVGEARLGQDAAVQARFLAGWSTTLNTQLKFAERARKGVESARLGLDATKAKARGQGFAFRGQQRGDAAASDPDADLSEEARAEIEAKEDEFVAQTEEAVSVMKNVRRLAWLVSFADGAGAGHAGAAAQPRRVDCCAGRVPQEGLRDPCGPRAGH